MTEYQLEKISKAVCEVYASEWTCKFFRTNTNKPVSYYDWELQFKMPTPKKDNLGANFKRVKSISPISGKIEFNKNTITIPLNNKNTTVFTS